MAASSGSTHGRRRYLIAYDITDDGRRGRVFHTLKAFGWWMQYSVFLCDLSASEKIGLRWELEELIDFSIDKIMMVDLGETQGRGTSCFEFIGPPTELPSGGAHIV